VGLWERRGQRIILWGFATLRGPGARAGDISSCEGVGRNGPRKEGTERGPASCRND
jgi:hypothetical protein